MSGHNLPKPTRPAPPMPEVKPSRVENLKGYLASSAIEFNYDDPAPISTKVNILTCGNVCITSMWQDGCDHKAWAPLPKRNKQREKELELS